VADALNLYGDRLVETTGQHGADIASQRLDGLDAQALRHALDLKLQSDGQTGAVLDIGCGSGMQALRFASLGLPTVMVDQLPLDKTVLRSEGLAALLPISYLMKDACALTAADLPGEIALCYSQRFIHYLRFGEALALLRLVRTRMAKGAKLFLSASGLQSELGAGYAGALQPMAERFSPLAGPMAQQHGIHAPVCLYAPDELQALGEQAGFAVERIHASTFGNVKGVFAAK
jgi:SAM-dependent methyltransferase